MRGDRPANPSPSFVTVTITGSVTVPEPGTVTEPVTVTDDGYG